MKNTFVFKLFVISILITGCEKGEVGPVGPPGKDGEGSAFKDSIIIDDLFGSHLYFHSNDSNYFISNIGNGILSNLDTSNFVFIDSKMFLKAKYVPVDWKGFIELERIYGYSNSDSANWIAKVDLGSEVQYLTENNSEPYVLRQVLTESIRYFPNKGFDFDGAWQSRKGKLKIYYK